MNWSEIEAGDVLLTKTNEEFLFVISTGPVEGTGWMRIHVVDLMRGAAFNIFRVPWGPLERPIIRGSVAL